MAIVTAHEVLNKVSVFTHEELLAVRKEAEARFAEVLRSVAVIMQNLEREVKEAVFNPKA
ncbi:hypothetical protein HYT01_01960 [Candidatus Giovannonibacteria bacterium]|nr:hypothetical protein [Candidatus Giovannonibacteria bacterium]